MIFELDMMPVAVQSLVSPHPVCESSEQRSREFCERMQREAIADSTDYNLKFWQSQQRGAAAVSCYGHVPGLKLRRLQAIIRATRPAVPAKATSRARCVATVTR